MIPVPPSVEELEMPRKPKRAPSLEAKKERKMSDPFAGKKDSDSVWVENLRSGSSNYEARNGDRFHWEGNGVMGSVISVPVKVAKEGFFRRNTERDVLVILSDDDANAREEDLVFVDDRAAEANRGLEALEKGASESGSRYRKQGLSEDGNEGRSIAARDVDVWKRSSKKGSGQVRRSEGNASDRAAADITAPAIGSDEVPDGPLPFKMDDTVKQGEWQSDTGE